MGFGRAFLCPNANGAGFDHSIFAMRMWAQFRAPRRVRMKRAMADRATARKAMDMAWSNAVRTTIFTDMAPSWPKVVATAAAVRKGMKMGDAFWVGFGLE